MLHVQVRAALPWTCNIDKDMQHGRGHKASKGTHNMERDLQYEHVHVAYTGKWSMDVYMQHGQVLFMLHPGCMFMSMSVLHVYIHAHVHVHAACPSTWCVSMFMLHAHVHVYAAQIWTCSMDTCFRVDSWKGQKYCVILCWNILHIHLQFCFVSFHHNISAKLCRNETKYESGKTKWKSLYRGNPTYKFDSWTKTSSHNLVFLFL
jgi:hypothetical protein